MFALGSQNKVHQRLIVKGRNVDHCSVRVPVQTKNPSERGFGFFTGSAPCHDGLPKRLSPQAE